MRSLLLTRPTKRVGCGFLWVLIMFLDLNVAFTFSPDLFGFLPTYWIVVYWNVQCLVTGSACRCSYYVA